MNFKQLFSGAKKDKTRQNLMVTLDNNETGDHDVLTIKTSSTRNIVLEMNLGQHSAKVSVNPDDLQDALNRIKDFLDARSPQPSTQYALGAKHLEATKDQVLKAEEQVAQQEKKILDFTN